MDDSTYEDDFDFADFDSSKGLDEHKRKIHPGLKPEEEDEEALNEIEDLDPFNEEESEDGGEALMMKLDPIDVKVECDVLINEEEDDVEEVDERKLKKRRQARERARRCREARKIKMQKIAEKEMLLKGVGQEDDSEEHFEEEEFKASEEERLRVQREKMREKRQAEKERLQKIAQLEKRILLAGRGDPLTREEMRLKLKEEGRKKLNTENQRKKRLADKMRLEEIQEKEEVGADVLEACSEIGKGECGDNEEDDKDSKEDTEEYLSSVKLEINVEDLQFKEKLERQRILNRERARRMRAKKKELDGGKDGRKGRKRNFAADKLSKEDKTDLICPVCSEVFDRRPSLASHMAKVHPDYEKNFTCDQCKYAAYFPADLNMHIRQNHEGLKDRYACNYEGCDYKSNFSSGLKMHVKRAHLGWLPPQVTCDMCDYQGTKLMVKWHREAEHENIVHSCALCEFQSKWVASLNHHIKEFHTNPKSIICDLCGYRTGRKRNMKLHMEAIHFNIKHYCDQCDFHTGYPQKLAMHRKKVHTEGVEPELPTPAPKEAECPVCSEVVFRRVMARHIQTEHPGSEYYKQCDDCGDAFLTKDSLKKHKEKNQASCLNRQMKRREEESRSSPGGPEMSSEDQNSILLAKLGECPVCGESISRRRMAQHIYREHPRSEHYSQCGDCGQVFLRKDELRRHRERNQPACLNRQAKAREALVEAEETVEAGGQLSCSPESSEDQNSIMLAPN